MIGHTENSARRLLVVGPAWIGDMVMAQSLYRALKQREPESVLDVLAPAWSLPLLKRMPEVDEGVCLPLGHGQLGLAARYRLGRALRARRYDQAIVLPRSAKAALVPFFAGARRRTGFRGEWRYGLLNDIRKLDRERLPQVIQRYLALGQPATALWPPEEIPLPALQVDPRARDAARSRLSLASDQPVLALCPGAEYGPAKRWPAESFAAVARKAMEQGMQVWLFGSESDRPVAEAVNVAAGGGADDLTGRTSLTEALDLLSLARVTVTNDSGLMHVAAAVGSAVVALFGSSSPKYTPPLTEKAEICHLALPCSPCFARTCKLGDYRCLTGLTPERVWGAVETRLATG